MTRHSQTANNGLIYLLGLVGMVAITAIALVVFLLNRDTGEVVGDDFQEVATIVINGDLTHVFASTEDENQGCGYFYSGVDETQFIVIELTGGAFAANGDSFEVGGSTYGELGNTDDALIFADALGVYRFTANDFKICISRDLAIVKADRTISQQPDRYIEYAISPN